MPSPDFNAGSRPSSPVGGQFRTAIAPFFCHDPESEKRRFFNGLLAGEQPALDWRTFSLRECSSLFVFASGVTEERGIVLKPLTRSLVSEAFHMDALGIFLAAGLEIDQRQYLPG